MKQQPHTTLFRVLCLAIATLTTAHAGDDSVVIDPKGLVVKGKTVALSGAYSREAVGKAIQDALGKPTKIIQTKIDGELLVYEGISLYPTSEFGLLTITLKSNEHQVAYGGTVSLEDVQITSDTSISLLNASLEGRVFKQKTSSPTGLSFWELKYDGFTVSVACKENSKITAISVNPASTK